MAGVPAVPVRRAVRVATDPWIAFFGLVLAAWVTLAAVASGRGPLQHTIDGGADESAPVMVTNTGYWMGADVVVAHATQSRVRAFGRVWNFVGRSAEICSIDWSGP